MNIYENNNYKISTFTKFYLSTILVLALYAGYFDTSIPSIILSIVLIFLYLFKFNFNLKQLIFIFIFILYFLIIILFSQSITTSLSDFKFYYGSLFFLILFRDQKIRLYLCNYLSSHKVFLFFLFIMFIETFLINLIITPIDLYGDEFKSSTIGNYNRPLGGSGNSSMQSTLIVAWFLSLNFKISNLQKIITFIVYSFGILVLMSGTGFLLYFISLLASQSKYLKNKITKNNLIILILITLFTLIFLEIISNSYSQKLSITYYINTFIHKYSFLSDSLEIANRQLFTNQYMADIFGYTFLSKVSLTGGDFGWFNLFYAHGILGFIIYILMIFCFSSKTIKNKLSILILFIGAFHYAVIFSAAGQLLLAKLINNDK